MSRSASSAPDVPLELEAIIDKMTAKLPLQRYQTAKEVAEKVRTWLRESESARTSYSRISALMAEAARAKQSSASGTAPAPSKATDRKEFEFATLDEEPSASSSTVRSSAVTTKSGKLGMTKEGSAAALGTKDQEHPSAVQKAVPPVAKRPPTKLAKSPSGRLLPDDLISALPPPETLVRASGSLPHVVQQQPQNESTFNRLLRSPWPWVGLGGVVGLALLMLLVVLPNFWSTERVDDTSEQTEPVASGPDLATQPFSLKPALPPRPPPLAPPTPPTPPTPPAPSAPHPSPTVATPPAQAQNSKPAQPSVERLLAGLTEIGRGLQSFNLNLVRFYPAVGAEVTTAAERLHWREVDVADKPRAVLGVDLKADETSSSPGVTLFVELKYTIADGKQITLWKGSKQIVAVDLSAINLANEEHYKEIAANNTAVLLEQLVSDVVSVRALVGSK